MLQSSRPTGWKKVQHLALSRTLLNSALSSLLPNLQLLLFPKWLRCLKKKNHLMLSVYVNSAWTVSVWLLPMSPRQPWSTADALGSRAAGTTSRSGASSGYHQLLAPRSCLVFPAFFFLFFLPTIFLPTLFLSPPSPLHWLPQVTEGHLETFVVLFEKIQLSP